MGAAGGVDPLGGLGAVSGGVEGTALPPAPATLLQQTTTAPPSGGDATGGAAATSDAVQLIAGLLRDVGVPDGVAVVLAGIVTFVVVLGAVYLLGRALLLPLLDRLLDSRGLEPHARRPITKLANVAVVFAGVAVAFGLAGYGDFLQSLATIAAAATLAIGLAMQDVLKNFVAGVFIFTDRPFRIGDWVEWDDHAGVVEDISFRVTRVRTFDNELLTVPNSQLTDGVIKNPVAKERLRVKFLFGIGYDDDVERATDLIVEEARRHPDVLDDPEPSVRLTELADSYVGLQSRIWIANPSRADFVEIRGDYVTNVKARFDDEGIEIPFPQRDLSGSVDLGTPESDALAD
ncbi:mechanosensitive ion channel family protein [Candidatus Halobonum tyrrellensis]|uniref:Mechanosensitive ion channel protein MscS n=1 Tax=Candidatus Halobonum tyrrellensis G22 TaxID=1324957 RepID=V4HEP8_9EURY|nr:mechanosensitive ion channel family protein [Candidatus Halobonum tyrrellensis]ESP89185.1 mechanosensitive ion channel protein MscS [Candidatus Halobonum tyrrellensis G22]